MIVRGFQAPMNAQRHNKINLGAKSKSMEKLSSGFAINRAADDAAGLTISEKMRYQIRALNQGTDNAADGISWIQTGDGALGEVQAIIHRMRELTVKALNDTNTEEDRAAMQAEFDQLQSEIDHICGEALFNNHHIFSEHEPDFHQMEGNVNWPQNAKHHVNIPDNELKIYFQKEEGDPVEEVTITVPEGSYTTQELIDEIDDLMRSGGGTDKGLNLEYTETGTCNVNLENGFNVKSVAGGLSYLINDMYNGSSVGALIGTTIFPSEYSRLPIVAGKNDTLSFRIQDFQGNETEVKITLNQGDYTRQELLDVLNNKLAGTQVEAIKFSTGIKLVSDEKIITGFKGNMFRIDSGDKYTSVFYDNVMYGDVSRQPAVFTGGAVVPTDSKDTEHNVYRIDGTNNKLAISANGGDFKELEIDPGEYTTAEMAAKLNDMFRNNDLDLTAANYKSGSYEGLKITSKESGKASKITIDTSSSAYKELFVTREYTLFKGGAAISGETKKDNPVKVTGGENFQGLLPMEIQSGVNDSFGLSLNGGTPPYTIKLDAGKYDTVDALVTEIDKQLNGDPALAGYKGKLSVSASEGKILLTGTNGSGLTSAAVREVSGNNGYDDLFVGLKVTYSSTVVSGNKVTLNNKIEDGMIFDDTNNKMNVNVGGNNFTVTMPTGRPLTKDEIAALIQDQLQPETVTTPNRFSEQTQVGSTTNNTTTISGQGSTSTASAILGGKGGDSAVSEGTAGGWKYNEPETFTLAYALGSTTTITDANRELVMTVNGETRKVELDKKTYTQEELRKEIQKKLDAAYGTLDSPEVSLEGGKLKFEAKLLEPDGKTQKDAKKVVIGLNTNDGSFTRSLYTTKTIASATSNRDMLSSIAINASNNEFKFTYRDGSGNHAITLTLGTNTYNRNGLVTEINKQLQKQNIEVKASLSGNRLKLESLNKGSEYGISYNNTSGGNSAEAVFGPAQTHTSAKLTVPQPIQSSITIDDSTKEFSISVDGALKTVELTPGTDYDRAGFVAMLQSALERDGIQASVSLNGSNQLVFTGKEAGSGHKLTINYDTCGTSKLPVFGETTTTRQGATASFDGNGMLVLQGTGGANVNVSSGNGGAFLQQTRHENIINPTYVDGYTSNTPAVIDGVSVGEPIKIDEHNKTLQFTYTHNGTSETKSFTLDEKDYTYDELRDAISDKLNPTGLTAEFLVTADASGVRIETVGKGSTYKLSNPSGGFYNRVLCSTENKSSDINTSYTAGSQKVESAFTIGRKDIRNGTVEIETDLNDELSFDVSCAAGNYTFDLKLDAGKYKGDALVAEIQDKLNEQLRAKGLSENMIIAQIGGVKTGVDGSNDNDSLCFIMNQNVPLPSSGEYIIDGVRGNAAFHVFYQSDGEMIPAYTKGTKDISQGVEITAENKQLSFDVDGVGYSIELEEKTYTSDELIAHLNDLMTGMPVQAKMDGTGLKIFYNTYGEHTIDNVSGSAKNTLFYTENHGEDGYTDIKLQLSGEVGNPASGADAAGVTIGRDYVQIERHVVNTVSLGINSITITKPKYANKALERLDEALNEVSGIRSSMGAMQNRLEHTIQNNENAGENTTAAEARIRDADMAKEMVEFSKSSILQQAAQAMMSQSMSDYDRVLNLLQ